MPPRSHPAPCIGYILRRILRAVPVLFLVTLVSFFIMQIVPGDPASIIAGLGATPQEVERVRHELGLDRPMLVQLVGWYQGMARGDLGDSILLGGASPGPRRAPPRDAVAVAATRWS